MYEMNNNTDPDLEQNNANPQAKSIEQPPIDTGQINSQQPQSSTESSALTIKKSLPLTRRNIAIGALLLTALLLLAIRAYTLRNSAETPINNDISQNTNSLTPDKVIASIPKETKQTIQWLETPQLIGFQDVLNTSIHFENNFNFATEEEWKKSYHFYKLGSDGDKDILTYIETFSHFSSPAAVFVKDSASSYRLIKNNSPQIVVDGEVPIQDFSNKVTLDTETTYYDLLSPENITYNGIIAKRIYDSWQMAINEDNFTEVGKINNGTIYEDLAPSGSEGVKQFAIYLKHPGGVYTRYRFVSTKLKDDNSLQITWKDGSTTSEKYDWQEIRNGCGMIDYTNVLDKNYFNDLIEIGDASGEKIYTLNSKDHPAIKSAHSAYYMADTEGHNASIEEFYNDNAVIFMRNDLGYRIMLVNTSYGRAGECGKPVIYLYPEKEEVLNVAVGADVRISVPEYGSGWRNVTAQPNGRLMVDGAAYDYLFWEGLGHGPYPKINKGFVVPQADVEKTLWAQLAQQGLNEKESTDFMEFWLPLIPKTPYVRLSWLTTAQMNLLAPLTLSKQPNTLIRVFLEFEGLKKPIAIEGQQFNAPKRKGFTVVEWGGLLQ